MVESYDDGKEDGALRTIGEVAAALRIKPHVLRYWEQQFAVLKPLKRSGGRRYYRPEDIELIRRIDRLVNREGYTLKGAKAALRGAIGVEAVEEAAQGAQARAIAPGVIEGLKAIRSDLARAMAG